MSERDDPVRRLRVPLTLRIAHVSIWHTPLDVRIFQKECRTLAAAGHEVHYLVASPPAPEVDGVHFHPIPGLNGIRYAWRALPHLPEVYRAARALDADVYHLHDPHLIPVGLALKRHGSTVVYDAHEDYPRQALSIYASRLFLSGSHYLIWSLLEREARRRFDVFVAATPAITRRFPAPKTVTIRNFPLPAEFFRPSLDGAMIPYGERAHAVVYAGGITVVRGIREMVDMVGLLPPELDAKLVLMGEFKKELPRLQAEVEGRPGWSRVEYLGDRPRHEVIDELARARVGLVLFYPLPNHVEAMPNKLWEYMAAGLPIVASDFPFWRMLFAEIGCGLLVDPKDPRAIASAVEWLLRHPDEAEQMGRRGRAAIEHTFNWRPEGERLLELYRDLAVRSSGRGASRSYRASSSGASTVQL